MTELLSDDQVTEALQHLPGWQRDGAELHRTVEFEGFPQSIQVVNRIAEIAESEDHHPDIDIRFNKLTFHLSTHWKGGITAKDTSMAQEIDNAVGQYGG